MSAERIRNLQQTFAALHKQFPGFRVQVQRDNGSDGATVLRLVSPTHPDGLTGPLPEWSKTARFAGRVLRESGQLTSAEPDAIAFTRLVLANISARVQLTITCAVANEPGERPNDEDPHTTSVAASSGGAFLDAATVLGDIAATLDPPADGEPPVEALVGLSNGAAAMLRVLWKNKAATDKELAAARGNREVTDEADRKALRRMAEIINCRDLGFRIDLESGGAKLTRT